MNTATKNLENDHENILRLISVLGRMVRVRSTDMSHFEKVVYFIRNYADGFHHAKEEELLFPLMAEKGFSMQQGPVAVMLTEHAEGRNFVREMSEGITEYKNGITLSLEKIYVNAVEYCNLLSNHIAKENNILFRMADNALSDSEQLELLSEFEKIEKNDRNQVLVKESITAIEELELVYVN